MKTTISHLQKKTEKQTNTRREKDSKEQTLKAYKSAPCSGKQSYKLVWRLSQSFPLASPCGLQADRTQEDADMMRGSVWTSSSWVGLQLSLPG